MPLELASLEQNFRGLVRTLLGMPANSVHRANQFNPPPAGDQATQFATIFMQQLGVMGWDEVTHVNGTTEGYGEGGEGDGPFGGEEDNSGLGTGGFGDGGYGGDVPVDITELITGPRHFVASVQFFRGNAIVQANRLTALLQSSSGVALLLASGVGIGKIGSVRNLSALVDTYFENRAQLDIEFTIIAQEQITLETFDTFPTSLTSFEQ